MITSPPHTPQRTLSRNGSTDCVANSSSSAITKHTRDTKLHTKNKHMRTSTTPRTNTSPHHMLMTSARMATITHTMDTIPHYTKHTTNISQKNQPHAQSQSQTMQEVAIQDSQDEETPPENSGHQSKSLIYTIEY